MTKALLMPVVPIWQPNPSW